MARRFLLPLATILTAMLCLAPGAQARTPCPSEQAALTAQNTAEVSEALVCLTNQIRAHYGLPALRRDARLDTAARLHSEDMDQRHFFSHTTPDGKTSADRAAAQGYTGRGTGENIAFGYPTARGVVLAWMASSGHCRNILSDANDIGVGLSSSNKTYWTQDFGDFGAPVSLAPRDSCPHTIDLDAFDDAPPAAGPTATATAIPRGNGADAAQPDATPAIPSLGSLTVSRSRFRAGGTGSWISFTLSSNAKTVFRVQREKPAKSCGPKRRARKSCVRYKTLKGRFSYAGAAGPNRVKFTGRLSGKTLKPGRYRLKAVAAGSSVPLFVPFELTSKR